MKPSHSFLLKLKHIPIEDIIGLLSFILSLITTRYLELSSIVTILDGIFVSTLMYRINFPKLISEHELILSRFLISLVSGVGIIFFTGEWKSINIIYYTGGLLFVGALILSVIETYKKLELKNESSLSKIYRYHLMIAKKQIQRGLYIPTKISDEVFMKFVIIFLFYGLLFIAFSFLILFFMFPSYYLSFILFKSIISIIWLLFEVKKTTFISLKDALKTIILPKVEETMITMYMKQLVSTHGLLYGYMCFFYIFYLLLDLLIYISVIRYFIEFYSGLNFLLLTYGLFLSLLARAYPVYISLKLMDFNIYRIKSEELKKKVKIFPYSRIIFTLIFILHILKPILMRYEKIGYEWVWSTSSISYWIIIGLGSSCIALIFISKIIKLKSYLSHKIEIYYLVLLLFLMVFISYWHTGLEGLLKNSCIILGILTLESILFRELEPRFLYTIGLIFSYFSGLYFYIFDLLWIGIILWIFLAFILLPLIIIPEKHLKMIIQKIVTIITKLYN